MKKSQLKSLIREIVTELMMEKSKKVAPVVDPVNFTYVAELGGQFTNIKHTGAVGKNHKNYAKYTLNKK
jgi:hypothetical protein